MCVFTEPPQKTLEDPMNLFPLYMANLNRLARRERLRATWYCFIIFTPLALIILASIYYGPQLTEVVGR